MYPSYKRACQSIHIGKSLVLLEIASVLQNRKNKGEGLGYLTIIAVIQNSVTGSNTLKAIIDLGSSFNLVSQMKVKEMQLAKRDQPKQATRRINGNLFCTYLKHDPKVFTTDSAGRIVCNNEMFLGANIEEFNIILGRLWFWQASFFINWENNYWTQCQKNDLGFTPRIALVNAEEFEAEYFKSNAIA